MRPCRWPLLAAAASCLGRVFFSAYGPHRSGLHRSCTTCLNFRTDANAWRAPAADMTPSTGHQGQRLSLGAGLASSCLNRALSGLLGGGERGVRTAERRVRGLKSERACPSCLVCTSAHPTQKPHTASFSPGPQGACPSCPRVSAILKSGPWGPWLV